MKRGAAARRRAPYLPVPQPIQIKPSPAKAPGRFEALMQSVEYEVLGVTVWFDPGQHRKGDSVSIRFSGQRVGVTGPLQRGDRFEQDEKVEGVVAGTGPVSVTARVHGINAGQWMVSAKMLDPNLNGQARPRRGTSAPTTEHVYPAGWSWRKWKLSK